VNLPKLLLRATFLALVTTGCVLQSEGRLMQADIKALRSQLDAVKSGIDEDREALRSAIVRAEKKTLEVQEALDALNHSARRTDADLGVQLDTLQRSVQQLTGNFEEISYKLDRIEKSAPANPTAVVAPVAPPPTESGEPIVARPTLPSNKREAGDIVSKWVLSKDPAQREDGKRLANEALVKWPKDEGVTDVIRIALGDRLLEEKQYNKAAVEYKKVLDAFPKGARADSAMFKIAQTFALMGATPDAKVFFEELVRRFPKSSHVKEAKAQLSALDKPKSKKSK
jgi:TolA-binding protein